MAPAVCAHELLRVRVCVCLRVVVVVALVLQGRFRCCPPDSKRNVARAPVCLDWSDGARLNLVSKSEEKQLPTMWRTQFGGLGLFFIIVRGFRIRLRLWMKDRAAFW